MVVYIERMLQKYVDDVMRCNIFVIVLLDLKRVTIFVTL